jgi:DNA-binding NarL/FixJ family response regulator
MITIACVDDHPATRAGVRRWLESADPPMHLIAEGESITTAWTPPGDSADVIVLDLELRPGVPAYEDIRRLADDGRRVVVYTHRQDNQAALTCIDNGATTYLTKQESSDHLVAAVHAAAAGRRYTSPSLAGALAGAPASRAKLSPREREILLAWFRSSSKQLVAERFYLSVSTVNRYIERAREKYAALGREASTKAELLQRTVEDDLINWRDLNEN